MNRATPKKTMRAMATITPFDKGHATAAIGMSLSGGHSDVNQLRTEPIKSLKGIQIGLGDCRLVELQAVLKLHALGISVHHSQGLPPTKPHNVEGINTFFAEAKARC